MTWPNVSRNVTLLGGDGQNVFLDVSSSNYSESSIWRSVDVERCTKSRCGNFITDPHQQK